MVLLLGVWLGYTQRTLRVHTLAVREQGTPEAWRNTGEDITNPFAVRVQLELRVETTPVNRGVNRATVMTCLKVSYQK